MGTHITRTEGLPPLEWDVDENSAWGAARVAHERAGELVHELLARGMVRIDPRHASASGVAAAGLAETHDTLVVEGVLASERWAPGWWLELWRAADTRPWSTAPWIDGMLRCARRDPSHREVLLTVARVGGAEALRSAQDLHHRRGEHRRVCKGGAR